MFGSWAALGDAALSGLEDMSGGELMDAASGAMDLAGSEISSLFGGGAATSAIGTVPATPAMGGGGMTAANPAAAGLKGSAGGSTWIGDALKPAMGSILSAAMRPGVTQHAGVAPSGHGVQASAGSANQGANMIINLAGGDPLQGIQGWGNLFK